MPVHQRLWKTVISERNESCDFLSLTFRGCGCCCWMIWAVVAGLTYRGQCCGRIYGCRYMHNHTWEREREVQMRQDKDKTKVDLYMLRNMTGSQCNEIWKHVHHISTDLKWQISRHPYDSCNIQKIQILPEVSITAKSSTSNNTPRGKLFFYERTFVKYRLHGMKISNEIS